MWVINNARLGQVYIIADNAKFYLNGVIVEIVIHGIAFQRIAYLLAT